MTDTGLEVRPAEPDPGPGAGIRPGWLFAALVTAALAAAAIGAATEAMRWVMVNQGGYCASGGPYQINPGQECDGTAIGLLIGGILGGLVASGLVVAAAKRAAGAPAVAAAIGLLWGGLFGAFGWNFIDLGFNPPQGDTSIGWLISGFVFWLMALPGVLAVFALRRSGAKPERPVSAIPLVRARVPGQALPDAEAAVVAAATPSGWPWLLVTAIGAAVGAVAGVTLAGSLL